MFRLAREPELDEIIARSWIDPDLRWPNPASRRHGYDIATIYRQIARGHERAASWIRSEKVEARGLRKKEETIKQSAPESVAPERPRLTGGRSLF